MNKPSRMQLHLARVIERTRRPAPISAPLVTEFKVGGKYNWRHQPERLVYMGVKYYPGNGSWHQFALVGKPDACWSEVRTSELSSFEVTQE